MSHGGTRCGLAARPLERLGLLRSRRVVVEGPSRRLYTATAEGRRALDEIRHALRELAAELLDSEDAGAAVR